MGLDMYVHKCNTERTEKLETKIATLETEIHGEVEKITLDTDNVKSKIDAFIEKYNSILTEGEDQSLPEYLLGLIRVYSYGNRDFSGMQWELFNNYSRFYKYSSEEFTKDGITSDFIEMAKDYLLSEDIREKVESYQEASQELSEETQEIAYWRNHYAFNSYMCETFNCTNGEDTPLTLEEMKTILEFLEDKGDTHSAQKIKSIIEQWDDTNTYSYMPWW